MSFNNIAIFYNSTHQKAFEIVEIISNIIKMLDIKYFVREIADNNFFDYPEDNNQDLNIIVGGDGTLLSAARLFAPKDIPLLGINSGNLGFLAQLSQCYLEDDLINILKGDFRIEERTMLKAVNDLDKPSQTFYALNEIVIKRGAISNPVFLNVYVEDIKISDFLGDGLIIATPTGSTAYNISVGGPILVPWVNAFVISPIASHSLAIRPVVVPDDKHIKIVVTNKSKYIYLSADSQIHTEFSGKPSTVTMYVCKSEYKAKLLLPGKDTDCFFNILRSKMHWGIFPD